MGIRADIEKAKAKQTRLLSRRIKKAAAALHSGDTMGCIRIMEAAAIDARKMRPAFIQTKIELPC